MAVRLFQMPFSRRGTAEHIGQLYALYQGAKPESLLNDLSYLDKYRELDEGIIPRVVRSLLKKAEQEPRYANALASLFHRYADINNKLTDIFKNDVDHSKRHILLF